MFENSPIIKDHSRPAVKLAASGILWDYVKFQPKAMRIM